MSVSGFEIVQFNLMNSNLTNVFNPLINAVQEFRRNNITKGTTLIDGIVAILFPDNGEIWNPAAGNMFRRAVYLLFDYFIEQEKYIRYIGYKNKIAPEVIDQEIEDLYSKCTLFNVYSLIGELAAKVSKDVQFINVNPEQPAASEKDFLTLLFDAMSMLPLNDLRSLAIGANNSIKQIAGAQQTISGIYATLLTGLSVYADPTTINLMSGSLSDSFDVTGLGFPRRFGVQFDDDYVKKFRITKELAKWSFYKDPEYKEHYEGSDFEHEERIESSNWCWCYFKGVFDQEVVYPKLEIETNGVVAKTFYFRFTKGYKTFNSISYIINPITNKKEVQNGILTEIDLKTKEPKFTEFTSSQIDYITKSYRDISKPVIVSTQVYYSEKPKAVFAITPPHLQHYQKHILVIIKQIIDELYAKSYVVKSNRKPIVGLRLMLEEFGNIRSGENGIPDIDTVASIALGQNLQLTFVLQSFQQIRSLYSEAVEDVLKANSANIIFLKSNDKTLIEELVRLSGTRHEMRNNSKSHQRKIGDLITVGEPGVNYTSQIEETTALTSNDLLFLAGPAPGNSITFTSGEMPIVNKLANITPMAAGLHKRLPQPKTGMYSDSTMPSSNMSDKVNFLDNLIDGEALVRARVAHAKLAQEIKPQILEIAKKNNVHINERNGELATIMMNLIYEKYDKDKGVIRVEQTTKPIDYSEVAEEMTNYMEIIRDAEYTKEQKISAMNNLKEWLIRCLMDDKLDKHTAIYRDKVRTDIGLGFDPISVSRFIIRLTHAYPKQEELEYRKVNIYDEADKIDLYRNRTQEINYDDHFNGLNTYHIEILGGMIEDAILNDRTVGTLVVIQESPITYQVKVKGKYIGTYEVLDENNHTIDYITTKELTQIVCEDEAIVQYVQSRMRDSI